MLFVVDSLFLTNFFDELNFFDQFFSPNFLTNFDEFLTIVSFRIVVPTILFNYLISNFF